MHSLRTLPLLCLATLLLFACETLDFSEEEETATEQSSSDDAQDTDSVDDYISDTADFRGYGTLETYLKHYGIDSLHCIPLVDLLEGGCLYEAYYESTDNQTTLSTSARWVGAVVMVGYVSGSQLTATTAKFSTDGAVQTNILVGLSAETSDYVHCLPVQLSTSSSAMQAVREACNLCDNPDRLGQNAKFYGKVQAYFGVIGLKSVSDYTFTTDTVLDWDTVLSDTLEMEDSSDEESTDEGLTDSDDTSEEDSSDDEENDSSEDEESNAEDDDTSSDDTDSSTDDDTSSDANADDELTGSWHGYSSIEAYMEAFGNSYDVPIPLEDCTAGGCLYEYYTTDPDAGFYTNVWVGPGYIVGYLNRSISSCVFSAEGAVATNVLLAPSPSTTDPALCMPACLETSSSYAAVRAAYNLSDNPDSLGAYVVFYGNFTIKYGTLTLTHIKKAVSLPSPTQSPYRRRKEN